MFSGTVQRKTGTGWTQGTHKLTTWWPAVTELSAPPITEEGPSERDLILIYIGSLLLQSPLLQGHIENLGTNPHSQPAEGSHTLPHPPTGRQMTSLGQPAQSLAHYFPHIREMQTLGSSISSLEKTDGCAASSSRSSLLSE